VLRRGKAAGIGNNIKKTLQKWRRGRSAALHAACHPAWPFDLSCRLRAEPCASPAQPIMQRFAVGDASPAIVLRLFDASCA